MCANDLFPGFSFLIWFIHTLGIDSFCEACTCVAWRKDNDRKLNRDTCIVLSIRAERFLFLDRYRKYSLHGYGEMEVDGGWRFFFRGEKELFWKHSSFR